MVLPSGTWGLLEQAQLRDAKLRLGNSHFIFNGILVHVPYLIILFWNSHVDLAHDSNVRLES